MSEKTFYIHVSDGTVETAQIELQLDEKVTLDDVKKSIEKLGTSVCAYCGNETDQKDGMAILNHILTCEKRPEKKILKEAFRVEDRLYGWLNHLTDNGERFHVGYCEACDEMTESLKIYNAGKKEDELQKPDAQVP